MNWIKEVTLVLSLLLGGLLGLLLIFCLTLWLAKTKIRQNIARDKARERERADLVENWWTKLKMYLEKGKALPVAPWDTQTPETYLRELYCSLDRPQEFLDSLSRYLTALFQEMKVEPLVRALCLAGLLAASELWFPVKSCFDFSRENQDRLPGVDKYALKALYGIGCNYAKEDAEARDQVKIFWNNLLNTEYVVFAFQGLRHMDVLCALMCLELLLKIPEQLATKEDKSTILLGLQRDAQREGLKMNGFLVDLKKNYRSVWAANQDLITEVLTRE